MTDLADTLAQATSFHRAGRLREAEPLYRQVLQAEPEHAQVLYYLGTVCIGLGKLDDALACLAQAVRLMPEQADAYRKTNLSMDEAISKEMGSGTADLEITFERFLGSIYMTALMQMGMAHEPGGQPRLDILGARQTIGTLGLLAEKTKGNLTTAEQNFLQNALYELRMAYLEVTNALARGPQAGAAGPLIK